MKDTYKFKKTGAFILFDSFLRHGVKHIFGYPGGAILPIYDELFFWEKAGLVKHILVRHEQGAAHAADGYSRVTQKVGICFATSGPGATNLVTGIATAQMDSIPLIVITGQVGRAFIGTDAFQETDIFGITLPIVKHSYIVREARQMSQIIDEAFFLAQSGRPGPIVIDIPKDVGLEEVENYTPYVNQENFYKYSTKFTYYTSNHIISSLLKLIKSSSQPLLYLGGGGIRSKKCPYTFKLLMETFKIPLTTTLMGKGIFNETNKLSLKMLGMHGTAYANFAVSECDLLLALGARFDDRVTGKLNEFASLAKVVHVDIDPAEIGKNKIPQFAILGDISRVVLQLIRLNSKNRQFDTAQLNYWTHRIKRWKKMYPILVPQKTSLSPQQAISLIGQTFPDHIFTTDVGQHQMWAAQFVNVLPQHWVSSAGLGTMGFGLPAAIGAAIAKKKKGVICITGDSSFQMCLQELATVRQYDLPIKVFIINNKWQGMVRQWQESFYNKRFSHSYMFEDLPNFGLLANAYSINAFTVSTPEQLYELLRSSTFTSPLEIALVDIKVESEENCYPMVTPGKSNSQMMGISRQK